ncbi:MAG: ABC transporter ATP-binding protein [Lachnospiraceae bacterium]
MARNTYKEDEVVLQVDKKLTIVRLLRYLLDYKKTILTVLAIMFGSITISVLNPLIIERAIDVEITNKDTKGLIYLIIFAVALNIIYILFTRLRMILMATVSNKIVEQIRNSVYEKLQNQSFHFFDARPTGKILARIIGDVNSLKDVLTDCVTTFIPDLLTVLAVLLIMLLKNWQLAMAAIITFPILVGGMAFTMSLGHKRWQLFRKKNSNLNAYVHENFSGIRVVKSFVSEKESQGDFQQLLDENVSTWSKAIIIMDLFGAVIEVTWALGGFFLYFIGIYIMGLGAVSVGTFLAFTTYLSMFWQPIRNLASFYNKMVTNLSAAERVFELMDTEADIFDCENALELQTLQGDIAFEHVSFAYPDEPETTVLDDVSFEVKSGETIALVGPTGAGKTTIVHLLSRFYEATSGKVWMDSCNINEISLRSLRKQMGVMTQENFMFSSSVRDNIKYGNLDATDEEVMDAAKAVCAHDFIMHLPKGYDTILEDKGSNLSSGQKQLIAFARTMVSKPSILILDEATSSIDTHTELLVQKGIAALLKNRTSFIIAHRLSTIKNADRIFVVIDGKIKEIGNHESLLEKKGTYYELYESQFKKVRNNFT